MNLDISCPHCQRIDAVQNVEALRADGNSTSYTSDLGAGVAITSTGLAPVLSTSTGQRTHTSALARSLQLSPAERPVGFLVFLAFVCLVPFVVISAAAIHVATHPAQASGWLATSVTFVWALLFALPSAMLFGTVMSRNRRNSQIIRGRPVAHAIWRAAFYCHRCGVVYWPVAPAPQIPARHAFAPQQFRHYVWSAGGYLNA